MTDELREIAQQIIDCENGSACWWDSDGPESGPAHAVKLAKAWLAEHPADDDKPADDDWQMSIGLSEDRVMVEWDGLRGDVITWIDGIDLSSAKVAWNTRGDVRRLLAALGIEANP